MGCRSCRCGVLFGVVPALLLFLLVSSVGGHRVFRHPRTALPRCSEDYPAGVSILLHRILLACLEVPLPALEDQVHFIYPKGCSEASYP